MTKKILLLVLFCFILFGSYYLIFNYKKPNEKLAEINAPTSNPQNISEPVTRNLSPTDIQSVSNDYQLNYLIVRPTDIVELHSNLEEKLTGAEARIKYGCTNLVSGGFYDTFGKHIGLFMIEGNVLSSATQNSLFNGYFTIDKNKNPAILTKSPTDLASLRIALQSGPVLFLNGKPVNFNSNTTDQARRIVVSISNRVEITFISLYTKNNPISGPKLSELPRIIQDINRSSGLNIVNALNLDGGAHSTFLSDSANINELSTIGSFFCIKSN